MLISPQPTCKLLFPFPPATVLPKTAKRESSVRSCDESWRFGRFVQNLEFLNNLSSQLLSVLVRMLLNVLPHLVVEGDFVPVVIEGHHCIDRIGELRDEEQAKDRVEDMLVGGVDRPVAIEDRMTVKNVEVVVSFDSR